MVEHSPEPNPMLVPEHSPEPWHLDAMGLICDREGKWISADKDMKHIVACVNALGCSAAPLPRNAHNVATFVFKEGFDAYQRCNEQVQVQICELVDIYDHSNSEQEKQAAVHTVVEALWPTANQPQEIHPMTRQMKADPDWLKASAKGNIVQVDREAEVIRGYIVAQEGPFKSEDRGEFDRAGLKEIVKLIKASPNGLKSRFTHPDMTSDGLGKFLGRSKNPWLDKISTRESYGEQRDDEITVVRADLHLDPTSHITPSGDIGTYVMDLAESDPDAMSSSLVLTVNQEYRIDKDGRPKKDPEGNELPPLWLPLKLHASDVVDTGDAVDGILSVSLDAEGLPDSAVRQGAEILDRVFAGQEREVIAARLDAWKERYLARRFGEREYDPARDAEKELIRRRLKEA